MLQNGLPVRGDLPKSNGTEARERSVLLFPFLLLAVLCLPTNLRGEPRKFSAEQVMTETSTIQWRRVKSVNKTCQDQSRARGYGGFGYSVEACAFWDTSLFGYRCTIFTGLRTTLETLGHEVRHCFQGNYHR